MRQIQRRTSGVFFKQPRSSQTKFDGTSSRHSQTWDSIFLWVKYWKSCVSAFVRELSMTLCLSNDQSILLFSVPICLSNRFMSNSGKERGLSGDLSMQTQINIDAHMGTRTNAPLKGSLALWHFTFHLNPRGITALMLGRKREGGGVKKHSSNPLVLNI